MLMPHQPATATQASVASTPVPDQHGVNLYTTDTDLQALLSVYLAPELLTHLTPQLTRLGALAGGALDTLALTADKHPPTLAHRSRSGVDAQRIVITASCVQAVSMCLRAVTQPGDVVALESPTHFSFLEVLQALQSTRAMLRGHTSAAQDVIDATQAALDRHRPADADAAWAAAKQELESLRAVITGPRAFWASPLADGAVYWVEALDGGDQRNKVPQRDKLMRLDPPYQGEAREVHQFCALAGYGAEAINPYLAFETLEDMLPTLEEKITGYEAVKRYIKAVDKGILKVMSKMGISTYQSYCGAQIFDAVGLSSDFVKKYFTGTATQIEGVGLLEIAEEAFRRHENAFGENPVFRAALDVGGEYAQRIRGEAHVWNSDTISNLQHAVRGNAKDKYVAFAKAVNEQSERLKTMRGLFRIRTAEEMGRKAIDIAEVESAANIVKRFSTGAMSYGSISREAHTTLAIAMNRIGGKSNTGEGGEESDRYTPMANGDSMRSEPMPCRHARAIPATAENHDEAASALRATRTSFRHSANAQYERL